MTDLFKILLVDNTINITSCKQIDPSEFREIKTEYSAKLEKPEAKLSTCNHNHVDIKGLLDKGINNLLKLDNLFETVDIEKKREIISSMYPEKMTFNGFSFRTSRINEVARMIYRLDGDYSENKNRTNRNNSSLSEIRVT
jgi:site-specific DNA recombinase